MSTTIGNLTIASDLLPTTLIEIRIKTIANKDVQTPEPSHTIPYRDLEKMSKFLSTDEGIIEWTWNQIGDNSYYKTVGLAGKR